MIYIEGNTPNSNSEFHCLEIADLRFSKHFSQSAYDNSFFKPFQKIHVEHSS